MFWEGQICYRSMLIKARSPLFSCITHDLLYIILVQILVVEGSKHSTKLLVCNHLVFTLTIFQFPP